MANDIQTTTAGQAPAPAAVNGASAVAPSVAMVPASAATIQDEGGHTLNAFSSAANFVTAQRIARMLSESDLVPAAYRGNIANCVLALEMASRIGVSPFAVMQNLNIIQGKPSFGSSFLIATVNGCGRFSPLRYRWEGAPGTDSYGCRAYAKDRESGEVCEGTLISIGMAKAEGWFSRGGSKWKTMFEQMCCYRAAAFWQRLYAPELSLGMSTAEEVIDVQGYTVDSTTTSARAGSSKALEDALRSADTTAAPAASPVAAPTPPQSEPTTSQAAAPAAKPEEAVSASAATGAKPTKKRAPPHPPVDIDPETGEIVPPPGAGDAWEPGQ